MASALKTAAIVVVAFFGVAGLLFAALIGWAVVADNKAMQKASALCGAAVVGSPAGAALERAKKAETAYEPQWHAMGDGDEQLYVVFPAGLPLSGYVCTVYARDGVVTKTNIHSVD